MIYRKLIVLVSLLIGFVNIAFAGVGDLDTLNVRSQAPVKERMPVVAYKFNPKSLILPASLITVGAVGTAIDGMNDFHLFSRKDSVKQIHIDNYLSGECSVGYLSATLWEKRSITGWTNFAWSL